MVLIYMDNQSLFRSHQHALQRRIQVLSRRDEVESFRRVFHKLRFNEFEEEDGKIRLVEPNMPVQNLAKRYELEDFTQSS